MNGQPIDYGGVFAATLCAFHDDETLDEEGLRSYYRQLCRVGGLHGLVANGHTGEIMALRPEERARVTTILSEEVNNSRRNDLIAVSGVSAEGSLVAIDHALAAKEAGACAILLMPPHHWLRFGRSSAEVVGYFEDVGGGADIDIIVHQYPAWTKAGYSLEEMREIIRVPQVKCIKMGTRDMSRWLWDYEQLKAQDPSITIVTCHDEYLLPTLLEEGDGALIGFAGFAPDLMCDLVYACLDGDLIRAKEAQNTVAPLARLIYNFGEPGCAAHQRMKVALWLMGKFPSPTFRRPVRPLASEAIGDIRRQLLEIGQEVVDRDFASVAAS